MGGFELPPGPGKTAPRLFRDLLDYDPRHIRAQGENLLTDPPPRYTDNHQDRWRVRRERDDCQHNLCRKAEQSQAPALHESPSEKSYYISRSYCSQCLFHFDVVTDYTKRPGRRSPCELGSPNPLHHLRHYSTIVRPPAVLRESANKYDNWCEEHTWICSAAECPIIVKVRISPPRLSKKYFKTLSDHAILTARGNRVIAENVVRYENSVPLAPSEALGMLKQYLSDALAGQAKKRVATRNKKFLLAFADDCNEILEYLGFVLEQGERTDGLEGQDSFWALPSVDELGDNLGPKTNRNFVDDVIFEVIQRSYDKRDEGSKASAARVIYNPMLAWKDISIMLGMVDYPKSNRSVNVEVEEHPHYAGLGVKGDFDDSLIAFAYNRQRECDPNHSPYYLECLVGVQKGRQSDELLIEVTKADSRGEATETAIENAYKFFDISPETLSGDDYIIGVFRSRIESAPRQAEDAKKCLEIIGKARGSAKIQDESKTMTVDEAFEALNITTRDVETDSIQAAYVAMMFDAENDPAWQAKLKRALNIVAETRKEYSLMAVADQTENGYSALSLSVNEAYQRLQLKDKSVSDEFVLEYYKALKAQNVGDGSKQSFLEALQVVANERNSDLLRAQLRNPDGEVPVPQGTNDQPVGLENIGNTCYLNSLLQYYYTVKAVRDVVMNFDDYRMQINTKNVMLKRVGGRAVAREEIEKAQRFVVELQGLFKNLKAASTRSIKPTQDLAELTLFSSATEANFRRASVTSPPEAFNIASFRKASEPVPPPIPSRPAPLHSPEAEDIEMIDRPLHSSDQDEAGSDTTLVDIDQSAPNGSSMKDYSKDRVSIDLSGSLKADLVVKSPIVSVAEISADDESTGPEEEALLTSPISHVARQSPERRPPVPPRNKPSPIKTSGGTEDTIRAEKLRFGAQQDVTEVIGNVMFRLQCAIKPTSIDPTFGEQVDIITDTFYGANAVYLKKGNIYENKVEPWANIIVFPSTDGPRDIYEALDVVFDEQTVEVDKANTTQYASISTLPPVLQIQIQRTAYDAATQQASKNQNRIVFEETIYLDRYMDSDKVMHRRRDAWKWKGRLRNLEARKRSLEITAAKLPLPEALNATKDYLRMLQEEELEDIPVEGDLIEALEERAAELEHELQSIDSRAAVLKQKLQNQFTDLREFKYRLQAVFIHRGASSHGHYWIYIYDFARDVWREYNDERVTEVKDRKQVYEQVGTSEATPYYLVYVKDEDKENLVDAVCREIVDLDPPSEESEDYPDDWPGMGGEDGAEYLHIEESAKRREDSVNGVGTWDLGPQDDNAMW